MPVYHVGDTNMLVSKNAKICVTPNAKPKICVTPTPNPNASQWNIGGVFTLFVSISFALGSQGEPSIQWNMGFTFPHCPINISNYPWCNSLNLAESLERAHSSKYIIHFIIH